MKILLKTILLILFFVISTSAQVIVVSDTLKINLRNEYKISSINIIPFSENIFISNKKLDKAFYKIDYKTGDFSLSRELNYNLSDTIIITYNSLKLSLSKENQKRTLQIKYDDKISDIFKFSKPISQINSENIFGKDLQKSGSIIRGFSIGTNRDFTLNSGLQLQLTGKLSDEVNIVAALTDENIPIQPEGNTETLEELDKVFIEIKHKNAVATFGDYEFTISGNEFSNTTRKLQGLMIETNYEKTYSKISIASSRGKYHSNYFNGIDGNQGPYKLLGQNNEKYIVVIANSEKVYIDGNLLKRGENNDYTIDYSNAEITFTTKRIITSASRIIVEFEYSDQKFKRNFFGFDFSTEVFNNLKLGISYLRDGDDEKNPIDFSLTENQINILKNAGNDRNKAVISGVEIAPMDSSGKSKGIYFEKDTLINNTSKKIYVYAPGNINSIYNITFSFVGFGNGDYEKESLGKYKFVGINKGSYLPIKFLPMPELKQLGNLKFSYDNKLIKFGGEISVSSYDKNKISDINNDKNIGFARKLFFELLPYDLIINNNNFGKISLYVKDRFLDSLYSPFERIDNIEFNRDYNISSLVGEQILREFELKYSPINNVNNYLKYGYLKQGDNLTSKRFFDKLGFSISNWLNATYQIDFVNSTFSSFKTNWLKQNGNISLQYKSFSTGVEFQSEEKKESLDSKSRLNNNSLSFYEINPFAGYKISNGSNIKISFSKREESFPIDGIIRKQSNAVTEKIEFNFNEFKEISSNISLVLRNKKFTNEFKNLGFINNETVLIQSLNRFNVFNNVIRGELYYNASTEQTSRLEKVFVKVQKGSGNYIYLGDLNENGIAEENEFQISLYDADFILVTIPTDKLFPIVDLKTNFRFKIDFSKLNLDDDTFNEIIKSVSTETNFRIDEQNKDEKTSNIYLLKLNHFLDVKNTLRGIQNFIHDINILENNNELSFRIRFNQRKSLNQFAGGIEKGFYKEKSLRIRFKMIEELSNQTDISNVIDNYSSPPLSNRSRSIINNGIASEFSYRPEKDLEIGFKLEVSRSEDSYPKIPYIIDLNSQMIRANFSFESIGRLRIELERAEINSTSKNYIIPFEILKGNLIGKNYFARLFFDYRLSNMIQTSFSYDLRKQANNKIIHNLKAEARAIF